MVLVAIVRKVLSLVNDLALEAMRYDKPGGVDVQAIEQRVRGIGEDLCEMGQWLKDWHG